MKNDTIALSLDQLRALVRDMERAAQHENMREVAYIAIEHHPNGCAYLQIEQPCHYAECYGRCYRYNAG